MDYFRYKLAFNRHQKPSRFSICNLSNITSDHRSIGTIPSETEFQLGTPNLTRRENITIVLSNASSKDTVLLQSKWRPQKDSNLVVMISRLKLVLAGNIYEFDQTEIYQPTESSVWPGYIMQYGSRGSSLKLFVVTPCRRVRLVFRGHMRQLNSESPTTKFIKLNLLFNPTAAIYDFLHQFNQECFKSLYRELKPSRTIEQTMTDLLFTDEYEQPVRALGEYLIQSGDTKQRSNIIVWGFYSKRFVCHNEDERPMMKSKRILAHMPNGQLFHIGNNSIDQDSMDRGYTCFEVRMALGSIDKPFFVDWEKISEEVENFELEVSGEGRTFDCKAKRRFTELRQFFDLEMNEKTGWAWVYTTDGPSDTPEELADWQRLLEEHKKSIDEGKLVNESALETFPATEESTGESVLVSVTDPKCQLTDLVGSKASSLAQLEKFSHVYEDNKYIVPYAFVLTRFAYELILRENPVIEEESRKLKTLISEAAQLDDLRQECERLQKLVEDIALPEKIKCELMDKLKEHYADRLESTAFAVRSSSWGEDEEDMSAAGQLSTILGVRGSDEAIAKAVMACFGSKYTYANVEYKRQHGLSPNLPMAVVVQEMVECEKAGILFTCDPTSGDTSLLTITANYGLGESVVSGQSEPDSIQVRDHQQRREEGGLKIERVQIGAKKIIIDSGSLGEGERKEQDSGAQYDRTKCCLSDTEILKIANCGLSLTNYFQCSRDIEWGFKGEQLYLFQSRPITGLDSYTERELLHETDQSSRAEMDFLTRANVGEVTPYPVKPLTFTYVMRMWSVLALRFMRKLHNDPIPIAPEASNDEVLYYCYHTFFNMRCSMLFRSAEGEKDLMTRAMEVAFFGHEIGKQPELMEASKGLTVSKNLFQGSRYEVYTLGLKLMPTTVIMREKRLMASVRADVQNLKYATGYESNRMLGLLNQLRMLYGFCQIGWENHITIIMLTNANNVALSILLAKYIKDPVQLFTAISKILANSPNVISAEIPQRIESMADLIRAKGQEEIEKFLNLSELEALDYVRKGDSDSKLAKEFDEFVDRFGHRCYNEFEMAERSWRENPGLIVEMLKQNCRGAKKISEKKTLNIDQIVESLNLEGVTFKDRALLKHSIIPKCQSLVASRERTKDILVDHLDIMREASRMLAKEMRKNLRIPDEDLFYYLINHELEPLIREPQPTIVLQALRRRNMFKTVFKEPWTFDEIIKGPEIIPNNMKPSKELDAGIANAPKLYGTPASCGRVQAKVCLVMGYSELDKVQSGVILVTHSTDIGFSPVFPLLSGIITEVGGLISHGAVVAREYGLPSVLGIPGVTKILKDGEEIILDADNGVIIRVGVEQQE